MASAALFPRGKLAETDGEAKAEKKSGRKRKEEEVLFGTHQGGSAPSKKSATGGEGGEGGGREAEGPQVMLAGAVKAGSKGRPARLVKVQFGSYGGDVCALQA